MERQRGHVVAELDLVWRDCAVEVGHRLARARDDGVTAHTRGERTAFVGVRGPVVVGHGVDHTTRHLSTAGPVQEDHRAAVVLQLECGKLVADRRDLERSGDFHATDDRTAARSAIALGFERFHEEVSQSARP